MKKFILVGALLIGSVSQANPVGQQTFYSTYESVLAASVTTLLPSILTQCSIENTCDLMKVLVDAQEDAAVYVATEGEAKSAKLVHALETLRANQESETKILSDIELAQFILSI
jgi:Protein of unknown function (DUF2388).